MTKLVVKEDRLYDGTINRTIYKRDWNILHLDSVTASVIALMFIWIWIWFKSARLEFIYSEVYSSTDYNKFEEFYNNYIHRVKLEEYNNELDRIKEKAKKTKHSVSRSITVKGKDLI